MKHIVLYFSLFLFAYTNSYSQEYYYKEIEAPENVDLFRVIENDEHGFLLFYPTPQFIDKEKQVWNFFNVDTVFHEIWNKKISIPSGMDYLSGALNYPFLTLAFRNYEKPKSLLYLMNVNLENGERTALPIKIDKKTTFEKICSNGNSGVVILENASALDIALYFNIEHSDYKMLNSYFSNEKVVIGDIAYNIFDNNFLITAQTYIKQNYVNTSLLEVSERGSRIKETLLEAIPDPSAFPYCFSILPDTNNIYISGVYCNARKRERSYKKRDNLSIDGYFFYRLSDNGNEKARIFPRSKLKNLTKKKKYNVNNINSTNVIPLIIKSELINGNIVLLTEDYFPQYRNETRMEHDYHGRLTPRVHVVFEGYRFLNGVSLHFNIDGDLLYTNTIDLFSVLEKEPRIHIAHFADSSSYMLSYLQGNKIASKVFSDNEIVHPLDFDQITTRKKGDNIVDTYNIRLEHWYSNYFFLYGYQRISNKIIKPKERYIFMLSKFKYE
ncbi:MAG: hypothetical protein ACEPOV_05170 [Hyphomicrobiales bacterium]